MPRNKTPGPNDEQLLLNEIQLLLAEKRTYYALLRTGMGIFTLPLTMVAVLAGTSEYHSVFSSFGLGFLIITVLIAISLVGLSLFYQAERKIKRLNRMIRLIERENKRIAEILI